MAKAGNKKLMIILVILFVVVFGVMGALCYYQWHDNDITRAKIKDVDKQIKVEKDHVAEIQKLKRERNNVVQAISELTQILPTDTEASHQVFLRLLRSFAEQAGVVVENLRVVAETPDPKVRIKRYKYNIVVKGTFPEFAVFLNLIEAHTRFLKVDSFDISNDNIRVNYWPEDPEKKITLQMSTYTYKAD